MVAESAPDVKTRIEAQEVIETIEGNELTIEDKEKLAVESTLSETKEGIKKTAQLVSGEIPKYAEAFADMSKETVKANKQIGFEYLEMQRAISDLVPKLQERYNSYFIPWFSPAAIADYNARLIDSLVQQASATTDLMNNLTMVNLEAVQTAADANREYWKIGGDSTKRLTQILNDRV